VPCCTGNNSAENILGGFSSWLWMGGSFLGTVLIPFGIFFSSLVSATSSYVDDVAHT
jgi:hypothetical protein